MASPYTPKTRLQYVTSQQNYLVARSSRLSNFNPGSRIRSLLEALSIELERGDLETLQGFEYTALEKIYEAFGFARKPGTVSAGVLRIEKSGNTTPLIYPVFRVNLFGRIFETVSSVTLNAGETFVTVEARSVSPGSAGNITLSAIDTAEGRGTLSPTVDADRIWNPAPFSAGTEEESDAERQSRFHKYISAPGRSTIRGIEAGVLAIAGVVAAVVTDNVNPYTGTDDPGWVSVYISDGTASPPATLIELVRRVVRGDRKFSDDYPGYAAAGTRLYVGAVTVRSIRVVYSLDLISGSPLTDQEAITLAESAAIAYIHTLPVGEDVLLETLRSRMLLSHGDFYAVHLTSPAANILVLPEELARCVGTSGGGINCSGVRRVIPG